MAGKITFRHGVHPSRVGGWEQPVKLTDAQLASLGNFVGRPITPDEVLYIEDMLETVKGMRDAETPIGSRAAAATHLSLTI